MLDKLKEYRDVISIVLFFLGGFFWIQEQFPQRGDLEAVKSQLQQDNKVLRCLLKKNMMLIQDQIQASTLEKTIKEKTDYINLLAEKLNAPNQTLSPVMQTKLEEAKEDVAAQKEELKKAIAQMQDTKKELEVNICGEGQL